MSWFKRTPPPDTQTNEPKLGIVEKFAKLQREKEAAAQPRTQRQQFIDAFGPLGYVYELDPKLFTEYMNATLTAEDDEERRWLIDNVRRFPDEAQFDIFKIATKNPPRPEELELEKRLFYAQWLYFSRTYAEFFVKVCVDKTLERYPPDMRKEIIAYAGEEDEKRRPAIELPEPEELTKEEALATPFIGGITFGEYLTQENPLYAELALVMESYSDAEVKVWIKKNVQRFPPDVRDDIIAAIAKHAHEIAAAEKEVSAKRTTP